MHSKRGFGALLITVVMFSVLVSLGIALITVSASHSIREQTGCGGVEIAFNPVRNTTAIDVCSTNSPSSATLEMRIKNTGNETLEGVAVVIFGAGAKGKQIQTIQKKLGPQKELLESVKFDTARNGMAHKITVAPIYGALKTECFHKSISTQAVGTC